MTGTMMIDDVDGFLKFLDNVSFQLACLLDLDGQRNTNKRSSARQKNSLASTTTKARASRPRAINPNQSNTQTKRQQQIKLQQRPIRAKACRKGNAAAITADVSNELDHSQQQHLIGSIDQQQQHDDHHHNQNHHQHQQHHHHEPLTSSNHNHGPDYQLNPQHQQHHQHHQQTEQLLSHQSKLHASAGNSDTHTLDGQLTLGMTDELPLDHGSSISPATHLSPMDSSIHFNSIHQQHYYPPQRGHLDSYHLHDEFTSHDQIPIASTPASHINQEQTGRTIGDHHQQQQQQHLISHQQQQSALGADSLDGTTLVSGPANCYSHHSHHMQQQQHHHHHHHHHHQQQQPHYHQLDQQWLGSSAHTSDNGLGQLGATDSSALDHVAPLSPTSHQSLDQVQFNTPLYHHSYYNPQSEQLDSFQHISDDYTTTPSSLTTVDSSSSPIGHIHRMQQQDHHHHHQQQQPQQQQAQRQQQQSQLRMTTLDINNGNSGANNYDPLHTHQVQAQLESHQMHGMNSTYNGHNHHHSHHHHQMIPLMNGLETNGVILQDINLASASWSSPEDLYSI